MSAPTPIPYDRFDRLVRDHGLLEEHDPETSKVYTELGGIRFVASLPPVADSPAPIEACS